MQSIWSLTVVASSGGEENTFADADTAEVITLIMVWIWRELSLKFKSIDGSLSVRLMQTTRSLVSTTFLAIPMSCAVGIPAQRLERQPLLSPVSADQPAPVALLPFIYSLWAVNEITIAALNDILRGIEWGYTWPAAHCPFMGISPKVLLSRNLSSHSERDATAS